MRKEQFKWAADAPVVHIFGEDMPREAEPGKKTATPKPLTKTAARPRTPVQPASNTSNVKSMLRGLTTTADKSKITAPSGSKGSPITGQGALTAGAATGGKITSPEAKRLEAGIRQPQKDEPKSIAAKENVVPIFSQKESREPGLQDLLLRNFQKDSLKPTPLPLFTVPGEVKPAAKVTPLKAQTQRSTGAVQAPGSAATAAATPKPVQQTTTTKPLQRGIVKPILAPELKGEQPALTGTKPVTQPKLTLKDQPKATLAPELKGEQPALTGTKPVTQPKLTLKDQPKATLAPELAGEQPTTTGTKPINQSENEDAYKSFVEEAKRYYEMLNKDLKQLELGIDWVESRTEKVTKLIDRYLLITGKPYYAGKQEQLDALMQQIKENSAGWATVSHEAIITGQVKKDMEAAVRQARNYYYEAEKAQTLKKYDDTVNNEDFAQYSKAKGAPASMDEHEGWYIDEDYETYYDTENPHADRFRDMTDTEKAIYNYYLNKEGTDAAESYYEAIQDRLNRRSAEIDFQQMKGNTLLELEQAKWAGLGNFTRSLGGFIDAITGNEERKTPTSRQYLKGMIYEDLADVGGMVSGRSLGQWGFDALEERAEGIPSFVVGEMGGPVADILITGATAGGDKYTEMINKGYSKEEARTYAVLKGSLKAGIAWLINNISKTEEKLTNNDITELEDNVDNIVLKTSIQMADKLALEGNEAGLQELLVPWLKWCATGVEQDKANWTDIAYAALLGGLTAFAEAKDISKEARVKFALKEMERIYKGDITAQPAETAQSVQNTTMAGNSSMTGWDGRVAVTEATGPKVTVGGKTYELIGYDKDGSPVYQVLEE